MCSRQSTDLKSENRGRCLQTRISKISKKITKSSISRVWPFSVNSNRSGINCKFLRIIRWHSSASSIPHHRPGTRASFCSWTWSPCTFDSLDRTHFPVLSRSSLSLLALWFFNFSCDFLTKRLVRSKCVAWQSLESSVRSWPFRDEIDVNAQCEAPNQTGNLIKWIALRIRL